MDVCSISGDIKTDNPAVFRKKILDWYDRHRRVLPWRAVPGDVSNPYRVWLSEIMLQQTTVQAVIPYFTKFIEKWPDVHALAQADVGEVMSSWAGLGYYARARNLHECAKSISGDYGGVFPSDQDTLKTLPGIGDYTSAAISSIAFGLPATVVDGNVERVMARYFACDVPLPGAKKFLKKCASSLSGAFDDGRAGDYAQGLMDLGATICTPKSPACSLCPLRDDCGGYVRGEAERFPVRARGVKKPRRYGYVYCVMNEAGCFLIHRRPDRGLLGGMYGLPTSEWVEDKSDLKHLDILCSENLESRDVFITHVFTHFHLTLDLYFVSLSGGVLPDESYEWWDAGFFERVGMPTVFRKALKLFGL